MIPIHPSTVKRPLIDLASALYANNQTKALEIIDQTEMGSAAESIYYHLDKDPENGRRIFFDPKTPLMTKIAAVERVAGWVILQHRFETDYTLGSRHAKKFVFNELYYLGLIGDFSQNGKWYEPPASSWISSISKIAAHAFFYLKAYFSWNAEERQIRKTILECSRLQKDLVSNCLKTFMTFVDNTALKKVPFAEQKFYDKISDLYTLINGLKPRRRFPSELLSPIHRINQDYLKMNPVPGINLPALSKIPHWAFARLNQEMFTAHNINQLQYGFVPHYLFVHSIRDSSEKLKTASRNFQVKLAETVTDWKCASSYKVCIQKLKSALEPLREAWSEYANSHELLFEANEFFQSQENSKPFPFTFTEANPDFAVMTTAVMGFKDGRDTKSLRFVLAMAEKLKESKPL